MTKDKAMKMAFFAMLKIKENKSDPAFTYQDVLDAIEVLRTALAQPEPEPVAWVYKDSKGRLFGFTTEYEEAINVVPLYTAPPPRKEWHGLTDEEIEDAYMSGTGFVLARENNTQQHLSRYDNICFARAIEKTLGKKNNG